MEIGAAASMPLTLIALLVCTLLGATPVTALNVKASGVVSLPPLSLQAASDKIAPAATVTPLRRV
jgi:hypothetical protein